MKNGKLFLIPVSEEGTGHGTAFKAKLWKQQVQDLLLAASAPGRKS